jgi:hypothetical protein
VKEFAGACDESFLNILTTEAVKRASEFENFQSQLHHFLAGSERICAQELDHRENSLHNYLMAQTLIMFDFFHGAIREEVPPTCASCAALTVTYQDAMARMQTRFQEQDHQIQLLVNRVGVLEQGHSRVTEELVQDSEKLATAQGDLDHLKRGMPKTSTRIEELTHATNAQIDGASHIETGIKAFKHTYETQIKTVQTNFSHLHQLLDQHQTERSKLVCSNAQNISPSIG